MVASASSADLNSCLLAAAGGVPAVALEARQSVAMRTVHCSNRLIAGFHPPLPHMIDILTKVAGISRCAPLAAHTW